MKHLNSKIVSKSRDDVEGYWCWLSCSSACTGCTSCWGCAHSCVSSCVSNNNIYS